MCVPTISPSSHTFDTHSGRRPAKKRKLRVYFVGFLRLPKLSALHQSSSSSLLESYATSPISPLGFVSFPDPAPAPAGVVSALAFFVSDPCFSSSSFSSFSVDSSSFRLPTALISLDSDPVVVAVVDSAFESGLATSPANRDFFFLVGPDDNGAK